MAQFGRIYGSGVILRDFSPEGSRAHRPNCRKVHVRRAPDPSQAQDDPIVRGGIQTEPPPAIRSRYASQSAPSPGTLTFWNSSPCCPIHRGLIWACFRGAIGCAGNQRRFRIEWIRSSALADDFL